MLKRVMRVAAVAFAVVATTSAARADFVIDDFNTPTSPLQYSLAGAVGSTFTDSTTLSPGLVRDLTVTQETNPSGLGNKTNGTIGGGAFDLATAANTTSFASLLYTYSTAQNLSAGGTAVQFTFGFADLNTPFSVRIKDSSGASANRTGTVTNATAGTFTLDLNGFGVDLASVSSIELLLNRNVNTGASTTSADLTLTDVRITTPPVTDLPPAVPAPPALALFAAALPALGLARRFARKA